MTFDLVELAQARTTYPDGIPVDVCDLFERLALRLAKGDPARGIAPRRRFSSDAILHQIRWQFQVDYDRRDFKCNDHWTAPLARWFLARHPELKGFFELRERAEKAAA